MSTDGIAQNMDDFSPETPCVRARQLPKNANAVPHMKRLTLPLLLLASAWLASCEAPSDSSDSVMRSGPTSHGGGGTTAANPALTYIGSTHLHGQYYPTVAVMDSAFGHQTVLYTSATAGQSIIGPSWSPTNASICFLQVLPATSMAIKAVDVTTNTDGSVSGTNARTVYTLPSDITNNGSGTAWSNTTATNRIAYSTRNLYDSRRTVWVVPASGGTPVKVWETDSAMVKEDGSVMGHVTPLTTPTWSPDDSRIAIQRYDSGASTNYGIAGTTKAVTIMIFTTSDNGSTWSYTDSIKHTSTATSSYYLDVQWSRTGLNTLALWDLSDNKLYYANPASTSSITTDGVAAGGLSWSPNNSSILTTSGANMWKTVPFTTTVTTLSATNPSYNAQWQVRWRH
jgi:hypothetical protein